MNVYKINQQGNTMILVGLVVVAITAGALMFFTARRQKEDAAAVASKRSAYKVDQKLDSRGATKQPVATPQAMEQSIGKGTDDKDLNADFQVLDAKLGKVDSEVGSVSIVSQEPGGQ